MAENYFSVPIQNVGMSCFFFMDLDFGPTKHDILRNQIEL